MKYKSLFIVVITLVFFLVGLIILKPQKDISEYDSFLFTGDIMLGRYVETLMDRNGIDYPFLGYDLSQADFTVVNLEGPIPKVHSKTVDFSTNFSFKPDVAALLKSKGIDLVTLANNHTFDKGSENYLNTIQTLNSAGLTTFGHPRELNNLSYTILDEKYLLVGINEAVSPYFDEQKSAEFIKKLRTEFPKLFMIVNIHWGTEYVLISNEKQQRIAHSYIDNGADLIIGHHPHVVQEIEEYKNKMIFYSLGNYIFDQWFSAETQQGLTIEFKIYSDKTMSFKLVPVEINKSQPTKMKGEKREKFLKELYGRSKLQIGT